MGRPVAGFLVYSLPRQRISTPFRTGQVLSKLAILSAVSDVQITASALLQSNKNVIK